MKPELIEQLLRQSEFSLTNEPPPEQVIFRIDFKTVGSLGDYALLTGRPKAGKTKYLAGALAASLSRSETFGMTIKLPEEKKGVVHFDTEQGKRSHYNMLSLAQKLADLEEMPSYFKSYHCRQLNAVQVMAMIDYYLDKNPDCGLIFLDGLLDLIDNFNDVKDSKTLINWLKVITEKHNTFVLAVLHRSMSVDKSIGNVGSSADRAAQSVMIVEKNKETKQYLLKAEYMREDDHFTPVAIWYNRQLEIWERTDAIVEDQQHQNLKALKRKPHEYDIEDHRTNVFQIFNSQQAQSYDQIVQSIKEVYGVGRSWAIDCVKELVKHNLIWKIPETGQYTNVQQARFFVAK